jgi:hypothetical protein
MIAEFSEGLELEARLRRLNNPGSPRLVNPPNPRRSNSLLPISYLLEKTFLPGMGKLLIQNSRKGINND